MFPKIDFLQGRFSAVVEKHTSEFQDRVWSLLYSCDETVIGKALSNILTSSELKEPWKSRIRIIQAARALQKAEYGLAISLLTAVDEAKICSNYDLYCSLFNIIKKLTEISHDASFESDRKFPAGLVGDSHCFAAVVGINTRTNIYLPGLQLKFLSSPIDNFQTVGLRNAFTALLSEKDIILTVGEIDQRHLYVKNNNYWIDDLVVFNALDAVMEKLATLVAPWQKLHILSLPRFSRELFDLEDNDLENLSLVEDRVDAFADNFSSSVTRSGFNLIEPDFKTGRLDHAHFYPSAYKHISDIIVASSNRD